MFSNDKLAIKILKRCVKNGYKESGIPYTDFPPHSVEDVRLCCIELEEMGAIVMATNSVLETRYEGPTRITATGRQCLSKLKQQRWAWAKMAFWNGPKKVVTFVVLATASAVIAKLVDLILK